MLKTMCRTCGGFAIPSTSSDLFAAEQKGLLQYIHKTCHFLIMPMENLPTHICKNCEAEVIFPARFIKRYANAQFFFSTNAYREKLKLMERSYKSEIEGCSNSFKETVEHPNNEMENDATIAGDSGSASERNNSPAPLDCYQFPILTSKDIFKPIQKDKHGKPFKRQIYKCEQCNNLIIDRHNFIAHMKRHRGVKPFQCKLCSNKYFTNSELKRHNYRHMNFKPHKCEYCESSFYTKTSKDRHERIHTGERPYICETCGKRFSWKRNLRDHVKVHTGEKPYACLPCNKTFQRSYQLKTHFNSNAHKRNIE